MRLGVVLVGVGLLYLLLWFKNGPIPIHGGAGFDGAVYRGYIVQLAQGHVPPGDPYRLMRMLGFLPAILAAHWGLPSNQIVVFQAFFNASTLAMAAVIFFHTLGQLTRRPVHAACATGILVLSWPYAVMPVYYPLLGETIWRSWWRCWRCVPGPAGSPNGSWRWAPRPSS